MQEKVIDILTSFKEPEKVCVIGNEAVARAALEAGVDGVFSYPGTPSTEISEIFNQIYLFQHHPENQKKHSQLTERKIYFEYSVNEKVAMEKAIAFSIGNQSSMCVMKNVGLNVASDPLMSIPYQTITGPLVIVVCDDPGCHSSSNEQDSRFWGQMASVPLFNPCTPADAYDMTREAFRLSEALKLPVIIRLTTRVSHSRGMLSYNEVAKKIRKPGFDRLPEHINIPATTADAHKKLIAKLKSKTILSFQKRCNTIMSNGKPHLGIISSGVATAYACELLHRYDLEKEIALLNLSLIYPFPEEMVLAFLQRGFNRILVLEELEPIVENAVKLLAYTQGLNCKILGKEVRALSSAGEYSLDIVQEAIRFLSGQSFNNPARKALPGLSGKLITDLPPRPPALCAGCPHRATFYALKLLSPRREQHMVLCGDIGCFGLGALPPLKMIDTINHMGMSISMAQGLAEALQHSGAGEEKKTIALTGDGTFFHSGIASLVNAVYTRSNILLIIFDNRTIGMTGHQEHPGANRNERLNELDIVRLARGLGVQFVDHIDPFNLRNSYKTIKKAMEVKGVSVIVSRSPCIFLPEFTADKKGTLSSMSRAPVIDHSRCNTCHNHLDHTLSCSRKASPDGNLLRARAKIDADISMEAKAQSCPANICNHGFFFSILEKDYKSALEMVRDKMLFARTCGNVCHRPCELFSGLNEQAVPIKALKKYVSTIEEHFKDFSAAVKRAESVEKNGKRIVIAGAGPAGLSAAYDLIQAGYDVTVLEKEKEAGGLLKYAIPGFRMDKSGFDFEAAQLGEMGVTIKYNTALGKDIALEQLSVSYDAVLLAIGLGRSKNLSVIEKNLPQNKRLDVISFLRDFNAGNSVIKSPASILIVGGGNSAMDAARAAKKLKKKHTVILSCIENRDEMPAFEEEIIHAEAEGVQIIPGSFVHSCKVNAEGRILIELHASKTKEPLHTLQCDYVITAIGQSGERRFYNTLGEQYIGDDHRVKTDNQTGFSNYKNVFVAGDLCLGNHQSIIGAIASGKRAATGIRKMLEDYPYAYEGQKALEMLNCSSNKKAPETIKRGSITEHLKKYNLFQACYWCNHCIENFGCPAMIKQNGKVHIDEARCTRCGLCIDVCPNDAIRWADV